MFVTEAPVILSERTGSHNNKDSYTCESYEVTGMRQLDCSSHNHDLFK